MQTDQPHPTREDRDTPTVEAAAAFEERRGEGPTFLAAGRRIDVDERPSPSEL